MKNYINNIKKVSAISLSIRIFIVTILANFISVFYLDKIIIHKLNTPLPELSFVTDL